MIPKNETKEERFRRVAEARVNKILRMLDLLGNCSSPINYRHSPYQVDQIFNALQTALNATRKKFEESKLHFQLREHYDQLYEIETHPHVSLHLPDASIITAVVYAEQEYPAINLYYQLGESGPDLIGFVEYNPEHEPDHALHIGAYQDDQEDPQYYAPYKAERKLYEGTD